MMTVSVEVMVLESFEGSRQSSKCSVLMWGNFEWGGLAGEIIGSLP